jgi:hypothetical protein
MLYNILKFSDCVTAGGEEEVGAKTPNFSKKNKFSRIFSDALENFKYKINSTK